MEITSTVTVILLVIVFCKTLICKRKNNNHRKNIHKAKQIYQYLQHKEPGQIINYLRQIDPFVFEELILTAYKSKGIKIYRNKKYSGDGGIDGKIKLGKKIILLQMKRYAGWINEKHVKDFSDICRKKNKYGLFIHTGRTGKETKLIKESLANIEIISGDKLIALITN